VKLPFILVASLTGVALFTASAIAQRGRGGSAAGEPTPMSVPHIAPNAGSKYEGYLYGVIKSLTKDEMVLTKTQVGSDQTFKFIKKTKFTHDGKASTLESLKTGDEVWVDADPDKKSGDFIARKVVTGVFVM
jgi:hypothetical protein